MRQSILYSAGLTVFLLFALLILPSLVQDGMFMDGMIYSTVAKNLSNGLGSFWDLHLSKFLLNDYRDQPPLTIWITSFFFDIFGNGMYTERIYSMVTAFLAVLMIRAVWKMIFTAQVEKQRLWWFPVLLFVITPIVSWSFRNNMEENTMVLFILASTWFFLKGLLMQRETIVNLSLAVLMVFLAMMCKGIQGTFTLITPMAICLVFRNMKLSRAILYNAYSVALFLFFVFLLYAYTPSREYFTGYFHNRLEETFQLASTATTGNRFYLLYRVFSELLIALGITLLLLGAFRKQFDRKTFFHSYDSRVLMFMLLVGLAGTLPLLVTLEQRGFYLVSTLPYFSMGLACLSLPVLNRLFYNSILMKRVFATVNVALIIVVLILTIINIGNVRRDRELLHDVYAISQVVPKNSILPVSANQYDNWSLYLYLKRYSNIDVKPQTNASEQLPGGFFLRALSDTDSLPVESEKIPIILSNYDLLQIKH